MNRPILLLVALAIGYAAYAEFGDRLPTTGGAPLMKSDGRAPPAAPTMITGGTREAAEAMAE